MEASEDTPGAAPGAHMPAFSRRDALRRVSLLAGGAAAFVAAEACGCVLLELYARPRSTFGGPITVGRTADFPAAKPPDCKLDAASVFYRGEAKAFIVHLSADTDFLLGGTALADALAAEAMRRDGDGSYWLALYQACVHLGTTVKLVSCGLFNCPSHGATYTCDGAYVDGPAPRSLDRFPVSFDGDRVIVDTGRINQSVPQPDRASRQLAIPDIGRCLGLD